MYFFVLSYAILPVSVALQKQTHRLSIRGLWHRLRNHRRTKRAASKDFYTSQTPVNTMAPTLHLVRHAQGYHNLSKEDELLHDPDVTPLGERQCDELRASFPYHHRRPVHTRLLCAR